MRFARTCFERWHAQVTYWLTWNEINNQFNYANDIFSWTDSAVRFSESNDPERALYQASHYEFVAAGLAVKAAHEIDPDIKVGCCIAADVIYPLSCHPDDVLLANDGMVRARSTSHANVGHIGSRCTSSHTSPLEKSRVSVAARDEYAARRESWLAGTMTLSTPAGRSICSSHSSRSRTTDLSASTSACARASRVVSTERDMDGPL